MAKDYYKLVKPGIVYGNSLTAIAGFLVGSFSDINLLKFVTVIAGIGLVMAGACVANNILDINVDKLMKRTKSRPLPAGRITILNAKIYSLLLSLLGITFIYLATKAILVPMLAVTAWVTYVFIYGIAKRKTPLSTLIGAIPGALPPVAGYSAASGKLDTTALILFLILFSWQMPHFYAISIFRREEYKKAGLPLLSVVKSLTDVRKQIIIFCGLFIVCASMLTLFGSGGIIYLTVMLLLSSVWLKKCLEDPSDYNLWSKKVFSFSLLVLLGFSAITSLSPILP